MQPRADERVDRIRRRKGHRWAFRFNESPMPLIDRALGDPAPQRLHLLRRDGLVRLRRRHHVVTIFRRDAGEELAGLRFAGDDRRIAGLRRFHRLLPNVQPQFAIALLLIRPMAGKAFVRQDRAHIPVEIDGRTWLRLDDDGQRDEAKD